MEDEFDQRRRGDPHPDIGSDLDLYVPSVLRLNPRIPHYYGDAVRKCFLVSGCVMLFLIPVYSSALPGLLPIAIAGAVVLVFLAALTNPRKSWVMGANALVSGAGVVFCAMIALMAWESGEMIIFFANQILALVFLFSLYYSVKTVRAMMLGTIGRRSTTSDIVDADTQARLKHVRSFTDSGD